jgi:hypothetical protein
MLNTMRALSIAAALAATAALAQGRVMVPATKPALHPGCPAGTTAGGGAGSAFEATVCFKVSPQGQRVFHGPYVAYWPNGAPQSQGQYEEGFRSGRWVFFDQAGALTGETWFKAGSYDGLRVELNADGSKRLEEQWVAGKRQGPQKMWDKSGALKVVEYRDDRPVSP